MKEETDPDRNREAAGDRATLCLFLSVESLSKISALNLEEC